MRVNLSSDSISKISVDVLAIGVRPSDLKGKKDSSSTFSKLDKTLRGALSEYAKIEKFEGKKGTLLRVSAGGRIAAKYVIAVGLGSGESTSKDSEKIALHASRASLKYKSLAVVPTVEDQASVQNAVSGIFKGSYRFTNYLTKKASQSKFQLNKGVICVSDKKDEALKQGLNDGIALGASINQVRDWVNMPPNDLTPPALADIAKNECKEAGVTCKVWNKSQIEKAGMNLLLAVNSGSAIEPRLVHMHYKPEGADKSTPKVAFVGKGITFDAGGLCLKPARSMITMKCDMAGAAATLGIILAAAKMKLPVEVHAVIAATENMTGGKAYKPGDVYTSYQGKTVEIINTDAEGRLALADALAWTVEELKPDYIVDHATLTGACMVALGPWRAGLLSNNQELATQYKDAATSSGEAVWQLPLDGELASMLRSDVADIKHCGDGYGGTITAALFLKEFVGKTKWCHMDIAGPAFYEGAHGSLPRGGTGFGVSTAIAFLSNLAASGTENGE